MNHNITRLTPPKGETSPLAHSSWVAPERIAVPVGTVGANQVGRFNFTVSPPATPGQYTLAMDMVQEFVT